MKGYLRVMRKAIIIEQMGSAMFQPKKRISREEIMTPTLPSVSAKICRKTPSNILLPSPPWLWLPPPEQAPWSSCECPWCSSSEWACECVQLPPPTCVCPWHSSSECAWPWLWLWLSSSEWALELCEWVWEREMLPPCEWLCELLLSLLLPKREWECPCEPPPCEWPWWLACSPPCWNTNIPIMLTKKPSRETTNNRSWWISGGAANLCHN